MKLLLYTSLHVFCIHSDLKSDKVLDERHTTRSVKTVVWTKPKEFHYENDHKEKFVLKVISRKASNPKHVLTERNVMIALSKSVWHTELIKTFKTSSNLYIMMEHVPLGSLEKSLSWGRGLKQGTPALILFYAGCVLSAIEHMHQVCVFFYPFVLPRLSLFKVTI